MNNSKINKKIALIIMDGWGHSDIKENNAIFLGHTPNYDKYLKEYPHAFLEASGLSVGLPMGQMGNSEIGHTTIGAGSPIDTDLVIIEKSINDGSFFENKAFVNLIKHVKENNSKVHLIGLLSDGGVHSHNTHIYAFLKMCKMFDLKKEQVVLHIFTDARDVAPKTAVKYIKELEDKMHEYSVGVIGSFGGRYFGMDRAGNEDRIKMVTDILFDAKGIEINLHKESLIDYINRQYKEKDDTGKIDEYLEHHLCVYNENDHFKIEKNDGVFFFNFRADRAKQLTNKILEKESELNLNFVSMTRYGEDIKTNIAFSPCEIETTLGIELSKNNITHAHISESEKFPHVTFFMNGQSDIVQEGEKHIKVNSRTDIKTHDEAPEMMAKEIVDEAIAALADHDVLIINFPNADIVGHTGNIDAIIKAVEAVDSECGRLTEYMISIGGICLITADHGNAETMIDENGNKHVAHTINKVPCIITDKNIQIKNEGTLADIAPTILHLCGLNKTDKMKGESLILRN